MCVNEGNEILGVCRLQFNSPAEAQLRFMGVKENTQGLGIGRKLMEYAEAKAKEKGAKTLVLQARENALEFYKKCNYTLMEKTFLLWGQIQHYLMSKAL